MAEIKPLTALNIDYFHHLSNGYTSTEKYVVTKSETSDQTTITLLRQKLDQPYFKNWEDNPDLEAHYAEVIQQGLSLGLYSGTDLVGVAIAEKRAWNRHLWVWEFHIDPAYQGQGYGRKLMDHLAELGKQAGCRVIVCETQNTNAPAIHFYRRVGFEIGAVDLSYYTNKDPEEFEVAIFMKRYLE
jgi:ribosomal protein S18 acetylase RimI-like enzyme